MPFNWLKRNQTKSTSRPHLPIKLAPTPSPDNALFGNGRNSDNEIQQQDWLSTTDEPIQSCMDFFSAHPQGRCGFTTGQHDKTLQTGYSMTDRQSSSLEQDELFCNRVLAAENLEECIKSIKAEISNSLSDDRRMKVNNLSDDSIPDNGSDFTLWGNRIPR